jgi:hypothetical protein
MRTENRRGERHLGRAPNAPERRAQA